jgi:hypothetical protein
MLDVEKYKIWSAEFNPTSHFIGSWKKDSKILFLGTDSKGNQGGMVSRIEENIPGKFLSIKHLGIIRDGKEIINGPETEEWSGSVESYIFTETNGYTMLEVELDSNKELKSYFTETWPKALKRLKSICEEH